MPLLLVPPRVRGEEILDRGDIDPKVMTRSISDVARANKLFGGASAAVAEIEPALRALTSRGSLLDVATGVGDIPRSATIAAARHGVKLTTFGLDSSEALTRTARKSVDAAVCGNGLSLPFADHSVDVVMCSQFLHHMLPEEAMILIREMNRVARIRVVISDLRRSWLAAAGLWIVSFPLGFHPVTRHDGVVSVMRGFTRTELREIVGRALGIEVVATMRPGFRITTGWAPVRG